MFSQAGLNKNNPQSNDILKKDDFLNNPKIKDDPETDATSKMKITIKTTPRVKMSQKLLMSLVDSVRSGMGGGGMNAEVIFEYFPPKYVDT